MLRLEERDVPATTFTGTVFLDTNVNGQFNAVPVTLTTAGTGTTTLTAEVGYDGLASPFDPVSTRVPVLVQAFDSANNVAGSAQTVLDGTYTLTVSTGGTYRLEFSNLPAGVGYGPSGTSTGTAVRTVGVVTEGSTGGVNLALVRSEDITPDNPLLVTSSYVFGAFNSENANDPVVLGFPYNSGSSITGTGNDAASQPGFEQPENNPVEITHSQVGTTWGLAYNRSTNQLYMAAYDKRHAGFGPGTGNPATAQGQIYAATPPANGSAAQTTTATPLVNLEQLVPGSTGVNYRATPAFTDPTNVGGNAGGPFDPYLRDGLYLQTGADGVSRQVGWDAVGKLGLGGLDADPTGRFLYTVALGDRRLYVIDTANPAAGLQSFAIPSPATVTGKSALNPLGDIQPFAVQYYRGSIYVGAVNSGESTVTQANPAGDPSSLRAYVFQFKLATDAAGTVTTGGGQFVGVSGGATASDAVLTVPLNYDRGYVQIGVAEPSQVNDPNYTGPVPAEWRPWSPTFQTLTNPAGPIRNIGIYPQPMLTGLAFDTNGDITLGLRDRSGDQFGVQTPSNPAAPNLLYTGIPGGDTLKAFAVSGSASRWTLESNGTGPGGTPVSAEGVGNGQGPGGGEFYAGEFLKSGMIPGQNDHQELSSGGVLQLPGYADLATTIFDPAQLTRRYNSGGVRWFSNRGPAAGSAVRGYELYQSVVNFGQPTDTFAKANGVGDLVAVTNGSTEVGNLVWADLNKNGRQDPEDPGLGGVEVILYSGDNALATATTDSAGNYFFTSQAAPAPAAQVPGKTYGVTGLVRDSSYTVRIPLNQPELTALTLTTANAADDQRDSDAVAGFLPGTVPGGVAAGVIPVSTVGLIPGAANHTNDAGFIFNLALGDFVWNDLNNSGTWEASEPRFVGVRVELVDTASGNVVGTQTTNAQGGYLFTGLNPGTYRVRIPLDAALNPALVGYRSSTGANGREFGPSEFASGVPQQAANNADSGTTVGNFVLGPNVVLNVGTAPTGETGAANGDLGLPDTTADNNSNRLQDFGFFRPLSVGDVIWNDANNNGFRDATEAGIANVTVQLLDVSGAAPAVVAATVTNAAGGYLFTNLSGGTYQVRIVRDAVIAGFRSSTGANGSRTGPYEPVALADAGNDFDHGTENGPFIDGARVTLAPGGALAVDPATIPAGLPADPAAADSRYRTQDFGLFLPLELGNLVWEDINNDGVQQGGVEPGVSGIVLDLLDASGNPITNAGVPVRATTDANGNYLFTDLTAGSYTIRFTAPDGFRSSTGQNASRTGLYEPGLPGSSLIDFADHGTQDANSQVIRSTPVNLGDPALRPDASSDGGVNRANLRQDFGIVRRLTLGDLVWNDANNNGTFDAGEAPLGGVTVNLLFGDDAGTPVTANGRAVSTTTATDGGYLFADLTPGLYRVEVVIPAGGFVSSTGNGSEPVAGDPGNNVDHGTTVAGGLVVRGPVITLSAGLAPRGDTGPASADLLDAGTPDENSYRTQDFGFYVPDAPPAPLAVGDFVWYDSDNDGSFDAGETPASGVAVRLLAASGTVIGSAVTDANGLYRFDNLVAGTYFVEIDAPVGFNSSTGGAGNAFEPARQSLLNSTDKGTESGYPVIRTDSFVLSPTGNPDENGTANLRQDFGLIENPTVPEDPLAVGDFVWFDADNDGSFDAGEAPAAGITVRLLDAAGNVLGTDVTDADGLYRFDNLRAGTYSVEITAPAGFTSSTGANNGFEPARQSNDNSTDKGTGVGDRVIRTDTFVLGRTGNPDENGTANLRQDFGLIAPPPPPATPLAVGDFVWFDTDNDGSFDAGETPASGITVRLLDAAGGFIASDVTDASGLYRFDGLGAGTYFVEIDAPAGVTSSTGANNGFEPARQSNDNSTDKGTGQGNTRVIRTEAFVLATGGNPDENGTANLRQDFGLILPPPPPPAPQPASISGRVFLDADASGTFNAGDRAIPGTRVYLDGIVNGTRVSLTQLTDANGRYSFTDLAPGLYTVREQQPGGQLYDGIDFVGTVGGAPRGTLGNDSLSVVTLNGGDAGVNYDFSELPTGAVLGYTWLDADRDGVFERGEAPIPGVAVTISGTIYPGTRYARPLTAADVPGGLTVNTNRLGRYDFPNLPLGVYNLSEAQPDGFIDWQEQDGDPNAGRPTITNNQFTGVALSFATPIRGPLNFGETLILDEERNRRSPQLPDEESKRSFLGSSGSSTVTTTATAFVDPVPGTPGVVAAVAGYDLTPVLSLAGQTGADPAVVAVGAGPGAAPLVRVFDYASGLERFRFLAYEPGYEGGVRTATGDITGDGVPDIVTATGVGGGPRLRAFDGQTGAVIADFFAYEESYRGGLSLAVADVTGDGRADIVTGTDQGGGPRVRVFDGRTLGVVQDFFAFDQSQRGGVRVAAADFTGDGRADIVTTTGAGVPTRVRVFDAVSGTPVRDFAPYESTFTGGVYVAAGDFNGDGTPDIVTGADTGGGPRVTVFSGTNGAVLSNFFAFEQSFAGGVRVAAADLNADGRSEIVAAAGSGGGARVTVFSGAGVSVVEDFFAFDATLAGGAYVGASSSRRQVTADTGVPAEAGSLARPGTLPDLAL